MVVSDIRKQMLNSCGDVESEPYNGGFQVHPSTRKSPWVHSEKSIGPLGEVHRCTFESA